jgi:transposase
VGGGVSGQQRLGRQALFGAQAQGQRVADRCAPSGAWAAARTKDDYLAAQFRRLAGRIGKKKAAVAVAHSILVIAYHVIDTGQPYQNLGGDYFAKRIDPERRVRQLTRQLAELGYEVTLTKAA